MTQNNIAISARGVKKSYGELEVLKGIDLDVPQGSILALLGPNGAGKTTMVRILTTLLLPDSGEVTVGGFNALQEPEKVQGIIGLAGQYASVDNKLTAIENLTMIGRLYHLSNANARQRATELIERFDLTDAAHRPVKTFSGGMRRRLDLAASLTVSPPILFLDEPTTGLDPQSRNTMWEIIRELVKDGTTLLLTTQYLEEADVLADRIVVIDTGKIIAEGTASALKSQIGGERFDVVLHNAADFEMVQELFKKQITTINQGANTISFATEKGAKGLQELQGILDILLKSNVKIAEYTLHQPTLDDVFLQLTDHTTTTSNGN
jgi:ABC-2 type transport system ATP-binding protein